VAAGATLWATGASHATVTVSSPPTPTNEPTAGVEPEVASAAERTPEYDGRVVVYTTSWCPVCKRAKAWMNRNGVAYEERDIEASREYSSKMRALNPRGSIPTIDVDGDVLVGFSEQALMSSLERARQRHTAR
jgi:glutaredoxin